MTDPSRVYKRVTHRETTSPRSTIAIVLAVIIILLCAYAATETLLSLIGQPPLLAGPQDMATALVNVPTYTAGVMIAAGIVTALIGLVLIIVAFKAGRRARHILATERIATVVDDEVIASALARHASYEGNVDPDNARVSVARRRALVRITATSGTRVDKTSVNNVVKEQLDSYKITPAVRSRVVIGEDRKVGA